MTTSTTKSSSAGGVITFILLTIGAVVVLRFAGNVSDAIGGWRWTALLVGVVLAFSAAVTDNEKLWNVGAAMFAISALLLILSAISTLFYIALTFAVFILLVLFFYVVAKKVE